MKRNTNSYTVVSSRCLCFLSISPSATSTPHRCCWMDIWWLVLTAPYQTTALTGSVTMPPLMPSFLWTSVKGIPSLLQCRKVNVNSRFILCFLQSLIQGTLCLCFIWLLLVCFTILLFNSVNTEKPKRRTGLLLMTIILVYLAGLDSPIFTWENYLEGTKAKASPAHLFDTVRQHLNSGTLCNDNNSLLSLSTTWPYQLTKMVFV